MYTNGKDTNKKDQTLHKFRSNATHIELVLSLDVDFSPLDLEVYGSWKTMKLPVISPQKQMKRHVIHSKDSNISPMPAMTTCQTSTIPRYGVVCWSILPTITQKND